MQILALIPVLSPVFWRPTELKAIEYLRKMQSFIGLKAGICLCVCECVVIHLPKHFSIIFPTLLQIIPVYMSLRHAQNIFKGIAIHYKVFKLMRSKCPEMNLWEHSCFLMICYLLECNEVLTVKDLRVISAEYDNVSDGLTQQAVLLLRRHGYIVTTKENASYFAKAYISLTPKGNYIKGLIRNVLSFNPQDALKNEAERKRKEALTRKGRKRATRSDKGKKRKK